MKKLLLASLTLAALGASAPALAADLAAGPYYGKAPAYAAPIYNWTGFYVGAHLGGAISSDSGFSNLVLGNSNNGQFLGGLQAGADYQFATNWVAGIEGQYSWLASNRNGVTFPGGLVYNNNDRALGSITGRVGYTWGPGLLYAKGGYAYSDHNDTLTFAGVPVAFVLSNGHSNGWTVGAGVEYMFAPNWSAKAEYQYYNFGNTQFVAPAVLVPFGAFHDDEHTFKAGVNYRFNWASPVVARY